MDISDLKIGIENSYIPPFENNVRLTKNFEKYGFDSLWFPDHIMSWFPDAIWTPELVNLSTFMKRPHDIYNVFPTMAIAANSTNNVFLGTSVTETFRHPPSVLAHMILTLDHISKGRIILGIGAGEGENIIPYGIKWEKPVSRLEEAIKIIKLLWKEDKKVDFDGKFWKLKDAVLSLKPYKKKKAPPIWIGAFRPKMLELTGKLGDGWLPFNTPLEKYKEGIEKVQLSAKNEGRNLDEITPAVELCSIIDEKREECDRMAESPLVKNQLLGYSDDYFKEYGIPHPFGDGFYGALNYYPTRYDKQTLLKAFQEIPTQMVEDTFLVGTPDEVISKMEKYAKIGAKHIVLFNTVPWCDITKLNTSIFSIKKVLDYFKEDSAEQFKEIEA
ncbi:MAG: LLM class flavin-dependent oxidoreductase [Candidatus Hodarchaeota archaeon]